MNCVTETTISELLKAHRPPPLEAGPADDHVSDPFTFEGREYFFHYIGGALIWIIRPTLDPAERQPLLEVDGEQGEIENALLFMPPPLPPSEPVPPSPHEGISGAVFQGPVWYRGRQFIWFYTNDMGWNLALHADRDAPTQEVA
ncbi:MAG: hypothetical protein EON59_00965 [Alphaproteobacteria bacterium]|nr:MAG: hypothetical protein EON59_00965 [Alphaproteobacteria bacterium]